MWLTSVVLAVCCLALTGLAVHEVRRRERGIAELQVWAYRQRIFRAEQQRYLASRDKIAGVADTSVTAVDLPTAVTRFSHDAIASIPFGILEAIPATADTTKIVHQIHDEIAHNVYDAISGTTRGIAGFIRRGMTGPPQRTPAPKPAPKPGPTPSPMDD